MDSDPTTWSDVWLALAGAPIGAAITVFGVWLTNRNNSDSQKALLESQETLQRDRMNFELKAELQRETLRRRTEIYEQVLELCDLAIYYSAWGGGNDLPDDQAPISNNDLGGIRDPLPAIQYSVYVHCSSQVRQQFDAFRDAVENVDEASTSAAWTALDATARDLQTCVISAAVIDRTGGIAEDGLGGM